MIGLQECGPAPPRAPVTGSRARERAAQAVDYYNTHVHRAWANAGLSRSSFNDRHHNHHQASARRPQHLAPEQLYRSNSSLELLDHNGRPSNPSTPTLKREYGSHGSIDVIDRPPNAAATTGDSFFAMLQDYQPAVLGALAADQRSPGPAEYLRGKVDVGDGADDGAPQSPKARVKLSRLWGGQVNVKSQRQAMDDSMVNTSSSSSNSVVGSAEAEEIARRRAFSHYDCQSMTTNLNYTARWVGVGVATPFWGG